MLKWCEREPKDKERVKERKKGGSENISKCSTLSDGPSGAEVWEYWQVDTPPLLRGYNLHTVSCACVCEGAVSRSDRPLRLSFPSALALQSPQTQSRHPVRNYWRQKETRVMLHKQAKAWVSYCEGDTRPTHFVSNSMRLASTGTSVSGTAVVDRD